MIQKVFYGDTNPLTAAMMEITTGQKMVLGIIVALIFAMGIFPQPVFDLTKDSVSLILTRFK